MPVELPKRFTQTWIERTLPTLSEADAEVVLAAMRAKGWSEEKLRQRVHPHLRRPARSRPERMRRRLRPRLGTTHMSAVAGLVSAGAAVAALFGPLSGGSDSQQPAPSGPTGSTGPVAAVVELQDDLRLHVPAGLRRTCELDDGLRERYRAAGQLSCRLAGADQVAYFIFDTPGRLEAAYRPTPARLEGGSCGEDWNVESGYQAAGSAVDVGELRCFTRDGTAWIEWTRDELLVYAYTSRDDGNRKRLFQAWNQAGPIG